MALAATITAPSNRVRGDNVYDASTVTDWVQAILPTGMDDQDNSGTVIDPVLEVTTATRRWVRFDEGKYVIARVGFLASDTDGTDPVLEFYGRTNINGVTGTPIRLEDSAGNTAFTLDCATATNVGATVDGVAYQFSAPTPLIDRKGCNEVLGVVRTVYAGTAAASAFCEVKSL